LNHHISLTLQVKDICPKQCSNNIVHLK
jgi:hypothetical protein